MKGALLALLAVGAAHAAEPTTQPPPRLETGRHTAPIKRIATDASGRWVVTASDDKTARVWHLADSGKPAQDAGDEGKLYAVAMSPDGETAAVGGRIGRQDGREIGQKDAIDQLSRLTGRAIIAATADDKMALEGEGGHGAFTFALLEGLRGKADRNGNGTAEVRELADHIEERLPRITRKWGYEQFPFSSIEGQSFAMVPKP